MLSPYYETEFLYQKSIQRFCLEESWLLTYLHHFTTADFKWIDGERITNRKEIEAMGFSMGQVMTTMVDLFSAQVISYLAPPLIPRSSSSDGCIAILIPETYSFDPIRRTRRSCNSSSSTTVSISPNPKTSVSNTVNSGKQS